MPHSTAKQYKTILSSPVQLSVVRCKVQGARCKVQGTSQKLQGARCKVETCKVNTIPESLFYVPSGCTIQYKLLYNMYMSCTSTLCSWERLSSGIIDSLKFQLIKLINFQYKSEESGFLLGTLQKRGTLQKSILSNPVQLSVVRCAGCVRYLAPCTLHLAIFVGYLAIILPGIFFFVHHSQ